MMFRMVDNCTKQEYLRREALPRFVEVLQMQVRVLERTMLNGGPGEICDVIDAVELTLRNLRELVTREECRELLKSL